MSFPLVSAYVFQKVGCASVGSSLFHPLNPCRNTEMKFGGGEFDPQGREIMVTKPLELYSGRKVRFFCFILVDLLVGVGLLLTYYYQKELAIPKLVTHIAWNIGALMLTNVSLILLGWGIYMWLNRKGEFWRTVTGGSEDLESIIIEEVVNKMI